MKFKIRQIAIACAWLFTLWLAFWGGFYKSLIIISYSTYLGNKVQLADHQRLLEKLEEGDVTSVRAALAARVSVETSLKEINQSNDDDLAGWVLNIIYPREAFTLISVYNHRVDEESQSARHVKPSH